MRSQLLLLAVTVVCGINGYAASFDCSKAQSKVEHLICDTPEISRLDDDLSAAYKTAIRNDRQGNETVRMAQRTWLRVRNSCLDAACVKQAYKKRVFEIENRAAEVEESSANEGAMKFVFYTDGGDAFCKAALAGLNNTKPSEGHFPCISEAVLNIPNVSNAAWEELSLSQHGELAKKVMTANLVGFGEYFRKERINPWMYPTPEKQQLLLDDAIRAGGELFVLKVAPTLVLVTLRHKKTNMCGWSPNGAQQPRGERIYSAWVTPDLKEISPGLAPYDSWVARPVLYQEKIYLIKPYDIGQDLMEWTKSAPSMREIASGNYDKERQVTALEVYELKSGKISGICTIDLSISVDQK